MDDEAVGELELIVPWRVVFERLALQHQNNRMVKGLSIPIVRNNLIVENLSIPMVRHDTLVKAYRLPIVRNSRMLKSLSIPIYVRTSRRVGCLSMSMFQNNRFRFSLLIFYRPDSSTVLEMSIDSYVFQRNASRLGVLSRLDEP